MRQDAQHFLVRTDLDCSLFSGEALSFAVRYVTSEVHGARPEATKVVVILVMGVSVDLVDAAANAARSNRKCLVCDPGTLLTS